MYKLFTCFGFTEATFKTVNEPSLRCLPTFEAPFFSKTLQRNIAFTFFDLVSIKINN